MSAIDYDNINWEVTTDGDLMPRTESVGLNYPLELDVREGVDYGIEDEFTGTASLGGGTMPDSPLLQLENDGTGSSFTATVSNLDESDYRILRYRNVEDDEWISFPDEEDQEIGDGTIQITELEPGGYEAEAYARNGDKCGGTSVRQFVLVDDGTAAAYPVNDTHASTWRCRIGRSKAGPIVYHSINSSAATFDPTADVAVQESFDDFGNIPCTSPKGISTELVQSSDGFYAITDCYIYVMAEDLDQYAITSKRGDRITYLPTGQVFDLIGWQFKSHRVVWMLILREVN